MESKELNPAALDFLADQRLTGLVGLLKNNISTEVYQLRSKKQ